MKLAITGASGNFGRLAVQALLRRMPAHDLILTSRKPHQLLDVAARGAQCRFGDFDEPAGLRDAFRGADKLLLISATRIGARAALHRSAIDAAQAAGVRHIIYTSFIGVHPDNPALIMPDHAATEEALKASGLDWTILRDAQYAEAVTDAIAPNAIASGQWLSSSGEGRMAFVSRADCVDCAAAALTGDDHENKTYNITGPELLTYREACALVRMASGQRVEYLPVNDDGLFAMFDALGVPREPLEGVAGAGIPWCSNDMVSFEAAVRGGWFEIIGDDVEALLGRKPVSLRALLEQRFAQSQDRKSYG